jgi:hypothetical protein
MEIVRLNGLDPIVGGLAHSADILHNDHSRDDKDIHLVEEQATQCARAIRNLSVNRK